MEKHVIFPFEFRMFSHILRSKRRIDGTDFHSFLLKITSSIVCRGVAYFAPGVYWIPHQRLKGAVPALLSVDFMNSAFSMKHPYRYPNRCRCFTN